jgi:hypothetical protein
MCNLVMNHADAVVRSQMLATRAQLQDGELGPGDPVWLALAESFNDRTETSGGLIDPEDPILVKRGLNPEHPAQKGTTTAVKFHDIFKSIRKAYARASRIFFSDTGNVQENSS